MSKSTIEADVKRVMSARGRGEGGRRLYVQCCVPGCLQTVRKLRLHIRRSHKKLCPLSCSACQARFVGQNDLNNHHRNGCSRVMSERGTGKGTRGKRVQCPKCFTTVRKLRLHIRKFHKELCRVSCSDCQARFVEQNDLNNHHRDGCPRRKHISYRVTATPGSLIETFFENVNFSDCSAVNNFIADELQLDKASRDAISEVVDLLYKHLQHNLPSKFSTNELIKGGSVGKGTAVKDKADIDCVVFLNNVKNVKEHKRNLQDTKDGLESCLKQSPYKDQIIFDEQTRFAVKFKFRLVDLSQEFNIDLLPTFTTDQTQEQLYKKMIGTKKNKGYYSAHFVRLQREFVKSQPSSVKDLIRLVKYWRKTCIEDKSTGKTRLPSSYPLELITIDCWQKPEKPEKFDIRAGFKAVLERLVDNCHIHIIWHKYYDEALAERGINGMQMSESLPFVLDPANPTNNVCSASNAKGWKIVADVARMTLQRLAEPLKDIDFDENWQEWSTLHSSCHGCINTGNGQSHMLETFFKNVDFSDSSAVNTFITNKLQARSDAVSWVVDQLYKHLQNDPELPFSIHNLVKGGSVGKGTAVKDKADIDCVVFLNNVKTMEAHKRNLQKTKDCLESSLKRSSYKDQITFHEQTPFAVKFKLRQDLSREFDIDLLPTFTTDPSQTLEQLYEEMIRCTTDDKRYYSVHFVRLQIEFVKVQPSSVKNLIRLVKYWRKTCIEDKSSGKTRLPSSYPLELITIACWEKAGKPSFDIRAGFKAVLQQLVKNCHIHVIWHKYYSEAVAERGIKGMKISPPFVLDPANPTNNVCSASDAEGWKTVADVADMTLQRQPLKDITLNGNWQII